MNAVSEDRVEPKGNAVCNASTLDGPGHFAGLGRRRRLGVTLGSELLTLRLEELPDPGQQALDVVFLAVQHDRLAAAAGAQVELALARRADGADPDRLEVFDVEALRHGLRVPPGAWPAGG